MADSLILAIDQGTHSTRAIIFDTQGREVTRASQAISLQRLSRIAIEQSPEEIRQSMHTVVNEVLNDPAIDSSQVTTAGLATQRSSVLAWDQQSGDALSPVLSWQDRRTADRLKGMSGHEQAIQEATGLHLSPHYGAGKLQWLFENSPAVTAAQAAGTLVMGPLASYLLHHLIEHPQAAVDHANASRTLLWNLRSRDWDSDLLALFNLPAQVLPTCYPICADYGPLQDRDIPLSAVNGDQTAALYAQGKPAENTLIVNIGTGAFVLLPVADPTLRPARLLAGISQSDEDSASYYIEGTVNGAAAALEWAMQQFNVTDIKDKLPGWIIDVPAPTLFINTVGGLGAPWWKSGPAPHFLDATVSAPGAMVAVIESIVFLLQANITLIQSQYPAVEKIQLSGGVSSLDGLCRKLASLSGLIVYRPVQVEATARGIAWQACGCPDDWPATGEGETFTPVDDPALQARYTRFISILEQA